MIEIPDGNRKDVDLRSAIVREAQSWRGTPFRINQCVKGSGVDCGRFIAAVYRAVGITIPIDLPIFRPNWHQNTREERYLDLVAKYLRPVEIPEIDEADLVLFRLRPRYPFSHAGIVTAWPRVLHANGLQKHDCVQELDTSLSPASFWEIRAFSPI